jgi:hypothetical protein
MGPDTLGTVENEYGSAIHENGTRRSWISSKTSSGALNMKTGPDALKTVEKDSGLAKHENGNRRPRYR